MKIPINTKLKPTKSNNYDIIDKRLDWLWKTSDDVYEFLSESEINNLLNKFILELNIEDFGFQEYKLLRGQYREYFLITENNKFNLKVIDFIGKKFFSNFNCKLKTYRKNKVVEFSFQQNFLKEKAHNIIPNSEKICNIKFEKRNNLELYMIRFDRFSDSNIFYNLDGRNYIPNEISKKIELVRSGDFGSANEGFLCSDNSLKIIINELQKYNYEVGFKNILD